MTQTDTNQSPKNKPQPMIDLLISVFIPSIILMKFSDASDLGAENALLVALAFPFFWGLFELIRHKKFNLIAVFGIASVLLTGGIGLLELDLKWLAIKEAAIPLAIGLAVLGSTFTRYPLVKSLLYNPNIMDVETIQKTLDERGNRKIFENRLLITTYLLSSTFLFSSVMNYVIAKWIVTSPTGSSAFNEELGRMTLLSYPMIAIPSMVMMFGILFYLWRNIQKLTGLTMEQILMAKVPDKNKQP